MNAGLKLAFTGAINDEAVDRELITGVFLDTMIKLYPERIKERYKITDELPETSGELLEIIGKKRGCLVKGGLVDLEKAQRIVLTDFRSGKLGTISLDVPPVAETTTANTPPTCYSTTITIKVLITMELTIRNGHFILWWECAKTLLAK